MTTRIQELIIQANFLRKDEKSIEKFAELIVRECAEVAQMNTPDTEECEYTHLVSEKILEHFGVEE
jgi:hypothetical protein